MVPGVPSGDRENWGYESLLDRSHVCFYEESLGKTNAKDFELFLNGSAHKFNCLKAVITLEQLNFSVVKKKILMSKTSIVWLTGRALLTFTVCK